MVSDNTSKIKIRPFIPFAKNEAVEGRNEFAVLKYGNVTIELDYTIMRCLTLDNQSEYFVKTVGLAEAGFAEIMREMHYKMDGKLPSHHRDSPTHVSLISHDPLHKINKEISHD